MSGVGLIQLVRTLNMLSTHRGATVEQIAEKLEIDKRSAYRKINTIKDLGFDIESIKDTVENRTRHRINREFHQNIGPINLPDIKFSPVELICLYLLKGESKILQGSDFENSLESAFKKIGLFAPNGMEKKLSKLNSVFIPDYRMAKNYSGKESIIEHINDAILSCRTCFISYHSFHDDTRKKFKIDPLHLFEKNGGLYLFVNTTTFDHIRVIAVERILSIEDSGESYDYPDNFNPDEYLRQAFGLIFDDPLSVEIRFAEDQVRYIKEREWSPTQEIIDCDDGSIILKMKTSGRFEIKRWVAGFGPNAEILQPEDLREEFRHDIHQLYHLYEPAHVKN